MLCNQRLRADDQNRLKVLVTRLQFTQDQTRLDGFTNTNAVCHKDTRTLRMNHFQCRTELVRSKIHTSRIQRIQLVIGGVAELLCGQKNF